MEEKQATAEKSFKVEDYIPQLTRRQRRAQVRQANINRALLKQFNSAVQHGDNKLADQIARTLYGNHKEWHPQSKLTFDEFLQANGMIEMEIPQAVSAILNQVAKDGNKQAHTA